MGQMQAKWLVIHQSHVLVDTKRLRSNSRHERRIVKVIDVSVGGSKDGRATVVCSM